MISIFTIIMLILIGLCIALVIGIRIANKEDEKSINNNTDN